MLQNLPAGRFGEWFELLDRWRRLQGLSLDRLYLGPRECAYRTVFSRGVARLRLYERAEPGHSVLWIVPAMIKRPYIWDLAPQRSVVRRALEAGFEVCLVEWTEPDGGGEPLGLDAYVGTMLDACRDAIDAIAGGRPVFLAAHSLGGTLAALYAAYRPERIAGLVLVEAPVHFKEAAGAFRTMLGSRVRAEELLTSSHRLPGSLLSAISIGAAPRAFQFERYLDLLHSLPQPEALRTHLQVQRWTLDELPLPGDLFVDVVEKLYREDRFMRGQLTIHGVALAPSRVSAPLLVIFDADSPVIPAQSVVAFYDAVTSARKTRLLYAGDTGVALKHVGPLVGDSAHREIWPAVFAWLRDVGGR